MSILGLFNIGNIKFDCFQDRQDVADTLKNADVP